jgi:hypothetical protein
MADTVDAARVAEFQDDPDDLEDKVALLAHLMKESNYTVLHRCWCVHICWRKRLPWSFGVLDASAHEGTTCQA